ncbi:MAG: D-2-hydroxyacid dehydrogenase [Pseudomonadota bacterium]
MGLPKRVRSMILAHDAQRLKAAVDRIGDGQIPCDAFTDCASALASFSDAEVVFGNPQMVAEIAAGLPQLKWVQSTWAGVTPLLNVLDDTVALTGVKDVFGEQMSEYVFAYLLNHSVRIADRQQAQAQKRWDHMASRRLAGKTLGVLGTGSIGRCIASTGRAFGMQIRGCSRAGLKQPEFDEMYPVSALHEFLQGLDFLVCVLPATAETDHLLDAAALSMLPENCVLLNVGRGNLIDTQALQGALQAGTLAAAVLDVFAKEPLPPDDPLWKTPNLTITPHIAAVSEPEMIAPLFVRNYDNYCAGRALDYLIDKSRSY